MSKLSADEQILDWFCKKAKLVIEANDEYYIHVEFAKGKYIYHFGDTNTNKDTETREMVEPEVLQYIKAHYVRKAQVLHKKTIKTPLEVWNYIQENPYI